MDAEEFVLDALDKIAKFDRSRFATWLSFQSADIKRFGRMCPPTTVYRLTDGRPCRVLGYTQAGIKVDVWNQSYAQVVTPDQIQAYESRQASSSPEDAQPPDRIGERDVEPPERPIGT